MMHNTILDLVQEVIEESVQEEKELIRSSEIILKTLIEAQVKNEIETNLLSEELAQELIDEQVFNLGNQ